MALSDIPLSWDLDSLWPNPESDAFASDFAGYRSELLEFAEKLSELPIATPENAAAWADALEKLGTLSTFGGSLQAFVGCHAAADASNETYTSYEAKLGALAPTWTRISLAFEMALRDLDDEALSALVEADPRLEPTQFFLEQAAADGRLRLPAEQETLYSELAVDGIQGWSRLYDRLSGELRIPVMENGEVIHKSPGQVMADGPDRSERINEFHAAENAWAQIEDTCADALNHMAGVRLTKYRRLDVDHLASPLRLNRLRPETLDRMWSVVTERKGCLLDFFRTKSQWLGIDKPALYDVQAPLPLRRVTKKMTYDQACNTVVETLGEFSPEFGTFAHDAIRDCWVEAEDRPNKRQGGFCTDLSLQKQSRIFMTFTGSPDSMGTLAHELGHAYHTYVLRDEHPLRRDYPMNLAETASTFAEAVVGDRRLSDAVSDEERVGVLDGMCGDAVAYLMNIHARFLFEDAFHKKRADGELTAGELSELMLASQKEAYRNGLSEDGYYPRFWVSKLHFYIGGWPFYNFPYTFGYLLSLGLFTLGKEEPDGFPEKFREFLRLTGCRSAEDAVKDSFGHDLTQPDFWNKSVDEVERRVREYVTLSESLL